MFVDSSTAYRVLPINVWTQENKNKDQRNTGDEKGVILPFLKAGRTLGVSNASGGGKSEKNAKKNAEIETLVTEGSSSIAVGGGGGNRTHVQKHFQ